jgi:hypothetical protein
MSPNRTATGRKGYFLSDDSTIVSGRTEKVCLSSARCSSFAKLHSNFHWTKLWDSIISAGEWVVVRWANADCKIWHNDTNAPAGYGWQPVAFASTWGEAHWKMGRLYQMHVCV